MAGRSVVSRHFNIWFLYRLHLHAFIDQGILMAWEVLKACIQLMFIVWMIGFAVFIFMHKELIQEMFHVIGV